LFYGSGIAGIFVVQKSIILDFLVDVSLYI